MKVFPFLRIGCLCSFDKTLAENCVSVKDNETCSNRDQVRIINSVLVGLLDILHDFPIIIKVFILDQLKINTLDPEATYKDDLFHTFPVDDILWQGFSPGIIQYGFRLIESLNLLLNQVLHLEIDLESFLPPQLQNGTLAFFRGKNATDENNFYRVNRGRHEKHKYCMIEELNGKKNLPEGWWTTLPISPAAKKSGLEG